MQRSAGNRATARLLLGTRAPERSAGASGSAPTPEHAHPTLGAARAVRLKRFEFDSYQLDSDDLDGFQRWCEGMGRVNLTRLTSMIAHLFVNGPGIDRSRLLRLIDIAHAGTGHPIPAAVDTIGGPYGAILTRLEELGEWVNGLDRVRRTIVAAARIDANAARIAAFRGHARYAVLEATGEQPSTGFDNESAGSIQERARVLLAAWAGLNGTDAQVAFFNTGFGNDPCIAARLNGVAEYQAKALGISEEALSGAKYDSVLGNEILEIAYEFFEEFEQDHEPDWGAFLAHLRKHHTDVVDHPAFDATYSVAKSAYV
ncbi:MAG: hypothetical protein O3B31_15435 [Chloroflexi bacterium]|nr:hypothetical protein [Chloroflexota bacterium]MDA1004716.1 hypothetical protein [Chloroflexota bacterium]